MLTMMAAKPFTKSIEFGDPMNQDSKEEIIEYLSQRAHFVVGSEEITAYEWKESSGEDVIRIQSHRGGSARYDQIVNLKDLDVESLFDVLVDMIETIATDREKVIIYREDILDKATNEKRYLGFTVKIDPPIVEAERWSKAFSKTPNHNNLPGMFGLSDLSEVQPNPGDVLVFNGQQWVAQAPNSYSQKMSTTTWKPVP